MAMYKTEPKTDFSFDFYGQKPTDLIYQGDAHFPTDTTYLRLTKTDSTGSAAQSSWGRVIYDEPVQLWKPEGQVANFETTVKFILKPRSSNDIPADGLVFFMVPLGYTFPTSTGGGDLGIYGGESCPQLFAVEFDIFVNEWDPQFAHVGINIETRASQSVAQIPKSFIGKEVTLTVTYVAATGVISAIVTAASQKVEASLQWDLTAFLPQQVQVGLAGSSGEFVAKHDVAFWSFHSDLVNTAA